MNLPDLKADHRAQSITDLNGQKLVLLINGVEADANQIATLRPQDVLRIEHQRVASSKWATSAGAVNFVLKRWQYGGNLLISADECFGYESGNYLAYFNRAKGNTTFATTINGKWANNRDVGIFGIERFHLNTIDFTRIRNNIGGQVKENEQSVQLLLQNITQDHKLHTSLLFSRKATPLAFTTDEQRYEGALENSTNICQQTSSQTALSPTFTIEYTKYIKSGKTLSFNGEVNYSYSKYHQLYEETSFPHIETSVNDKTWQFYGQVYYEQTLPHNVYLTTSLSHHHTSYNDSYQSSVTNIQKLRTENSTASVQLYKVIGDKAYYFILGGISNNYTKLNRNVSNRLYPLFYYGVNYAINMKNSLSMTGHYVFTNYSPAYKNEIKVQNSPFEFTIGNPNIEATKVYQNNFSYNTVLNKLKLTLMQTINIYWDNSFKTYHASADRLYQQTANAGNFFSYKFVASVSWNTLSEKLRFNATTFYDHIRTNGGLYHSRINRFWVETNILYLFGNFMLSGSYGSPHKEYWVAGPYEGWENDNYSIELSWNHTAWNARIGAVNFLQVKRGEHRWYNYGAYETDTWNYSRSKGRNLFLSITYSLNYGRKTEQGDTSIQSKTIDAIMRTY